MVTRPSRPQLEEHSHYDHRLINTVPSLLALAHNQVMVDVNQRGLGRVPRPWQGQTRPGTCRPHKTSHATHNCGVLI